MYYVQTSVDVCTVHVWDIVYFQYFHFKFSLNLSPKSRSYGDFYDWLHIDAYTFLQHESSQISINVSMTETTYQSEPYNEGVKFVIFNVRGSPCHM